MGVWAAWPARGFFTSMFVGASREYHGRRSEKWAASFWEFLPCWHSSYVEKSMGVSAALQKPCGRVDVKGEWKGPWQRRRLKTYSEI